MTPITISRYASRLLLSRRYSVLAQKPQVWSENNIINSPFNKIEIPNAIITEQIWKNLERWSDKTAVVCGVTNRSYTYHQLYKKSRNLAVSLRRQFKINNGDVICVMMPNSPEYCISILGCLEAGAIATTMNPIYTSHEVSRQVILSKPKLIIGDSETVGVIKEALRLSKNDIPIIALKQENESMPSGIIAFEELIDGNNVDYSILNNVKTYPDDVALLPYSSGTTGLPKGVELTNRNIVANLLQSNADEIALVEPATSSYQDSVLCVLPFYHIYGLSILMLHKLSLGAKLVTLPKFQPNLFLESIIEHRISLLCTVPPMVMFIGSRPDLNKSNFESVRKIVCAAAPIAVHEIHKILEKVQPGTSVGQLYGLTETSPLATSSIVGSNNYSTVGYAIPNTELKIVDTNDNALGHGEVGELCVRGPQVMKGYRDNEEATKNSITTDGWFKTGDLGSIDENGACFIKDRLKELIKVKGYQVPPAELESVLKEHPAVADAVVVGIPDIKTGEAPKAFIVIKDGQKIDESSIIEFVKPRVTEYKWIKQVKFIDSVPRNPSGKILRKVIKETYL